MQFSTFLTSMSLVFAMAITAAAQSAPAQPAPAQPAPAQPKAQSAPAQPKTQPAYKFAKDPDVPVLKVEDYFRAEGGNSPPMILVYADGRVVKPVNVKRKGDYEITISKKRLMELLGEIIEDNQFFEMDVDVIKNEVLSERKRKRMRPGFEFRVELKLADRAQVISVGHTWVYQRLKRGRTGRYKNAKMFHQFLKIEELSRKLSSWALVGGEKSMQRILDTANKEIQALHPGSSKVTNESIVSLSSKKEGRVAMCLNAAAKGKNPPLKVFVDKAKGKDDFDLRVEVFKPFNIHGGGNRK